MMPGNEAFSGGVTADRLRDSQKILELYSKWETVENTMLCCTCFYCLFEILTL